MVKLFAFVFFFLFSACTSNVDRFSDVVEIEKVDPAEEVPAEQTTGLVDYEFSGRKEKVEWLSCDKKNGSKGTFLVINRDRAGFSQEAFCKGWLPQAFLAAGFNVLGVNLPGYGNSTGSSDLGGAQSREAIAAVEAAKNSMKIDGIWGHSSGAIAAAFFAKHYKKAKWLVLGSGIYDLELTYKNGKDPWLKQEIEKVIDESKEDAFAERSISWDFTDLPKHILLYHGKDDASVPSMQASSFRDTLTTEEYKVSLSILEKVGHQIPADLHRSVLIKILKEDLAASGK